MFAASVCETGKVDLATDHTASEHATLLATNNTVCGKQPGYVGPEAHGKPHVSILSR